MLMLALDAALARCSAAVVADDTVLSERRGDGARGQAVQLPEMVREVLEAAGAAPARLDAVAVTVGPGSFTGIRAALALAHGLVLAAGCDLVAVSVGEALAEAATVPGRALWVAIDNRRGRVFLFADGILAAHDLARLPQPAGKVAVAGDAAVAVAGRLAARGCDVMLTDARLPLARDVARAARRRFEGERAPLAAQPIYVDPPEARLPAGGLRPPPA